MKKFITIILFIFIQQLFFAQALPTYNQPAATAYFTGKTLQATASDTLKKTISSGLLQTISNFPILYPAVKHRITTMHEPEITGFCEAVSVEMLYHAEAD